MQGGDANVGLVVGLIVFYVVLSAGLLLWYLWAMSRLFGRIGLPERAGWVPLYNDYKLMNRVGVAGWTIWLVLIGLGIVPWVLRIVAMHRLNREADAGGGYTFIGVLLPPLWATMLANFIEADEMLPQNQWADRAASLNTSVADTFSAAAAAPVSAALATPVSAALATPSAQAPLGVDTETEFARLAAEDFTAPPAVPLGQQEQPERFSWTKASKPESAPAPEQPPAVMGMPEVPADELPPVKPAATHAPAGSPTPPAPPTPSAAAAATGAAAASRAAQFSSETTTTPSAQRAQPTTGTGWYLLLPSGERHALDADTVLGRKPEAPEGATPIALPDATRTLSKTHARLRFDGSSWSVEDLHSTNGTVLLGTSGAESAVSPGWPVPATERLLLGTLEVRLVR